MWGKSSRSKKVLAVVTVLVLVLIGLYSGYYFLWWFKPAQSQRQTVQSFFSDVTKGDQSDAYMLTSSVFQSDNTYAGFKSQFSPLTGDKLAINYVTYTVSSGWTTIVGKMNDETTKKNYTIGFVVSNNQTPNKIGTINILPLKS